MTLSQLKLWAKASIGNHTGDVNILLVAALGVNDNFILTNPDFIVAQKDIMTFGGYIALRAMDMPVQHILGKWTFMGLEFDISPHALIPREDTEVLVNAVLSREGAKAKGLEIGLGSGCVSISLEYHGDINMTGVDICPLAHHAAFMNYTKILNKPPTFLVGDLYQPVVGHKYDFIVSNPPYIPSADVLQLDKSVIGFEPLKALDGGSCGLEFYERLVYNPPLKDGGYIYLEIGHDQAPCVEAILKSSGFVNIETLKDLSGHDRVILGKREVS